jgi:hypothetical protein
MNTGVESAGTSLSMMLMGPNCCSKAKMLSGVSHFWYSITMPAAVASSCTLLGNRPVLSSNTFLQSLPNESIAVSMVNDCFFCHDSIMVVTVAQQAIVFG